MRELAKGRNIDEEKDIWDKVEAIREYARQAKNKQLEIDAAEIKRRWFEFYPYPAKAGCPTVAGGRWTRAAPAGMAPAVSWS